MRHLGSRVSALVDGQLSPAEEEAAWAHVHRCHTCRDLVEHEGWVKRQLVGLAGGDAPSHLKGALGDPRSCALRSHRSVPVLSGMAVLGGGALGAAALGVVALVVGPGASTDRPPVSSINRSSGTATPGPARSEVGTAAFRLETRHVRTGVSGVRLVP